MHCVEGYHRGYRVWELGPLPSVPPQPLKVVNGSFDFKYIIARKAPYRLPSETDWSRMTTLVKAQKDFAMDHVIALTDDPGYFAEVTEQYRSHRSELLLDKNGGAHPHAGDFHSSIKHKGRWQQMHTICYWHGTKCILALQSSGTYSLPLVRTRLSPRNYHQSLLMHW